MFSLKRFACDERLLVEYQKLAGSHFGERGPLEPVLNVKIKLLGTFRKFTNE